MNNQITSAQIQLYQDDGFIVIEDFLSPEELGHWRKAVTKAVEDRAGIKIPGKDIKTGEADGINEDSDYFAKVFDQLLNLWQTNGTVKELMIDQRIGKMAAQLSGAAGGSTRQHHGFVKTAWAKPAA